MIVIPEHHNGPPTSAHGGIAAGRFAELVDPWKASVRFHRPIPLATSLRGRAGDDTGSVEILAGPDLIATVTSPASQAEVGPFEPVTQPDLAAAQSDWRQAMAVDHPFPTCFGCGPNRSADSGLALRPGKPTGSDQYVTAWSPEEEGHLAPWLVWAALDCPSGAPALGAVGSAEQVVTGTISASIDTPIPGRGEYQILSRLTDRSGRKLTTEAALIGSDGRTLATCVALWIAVPRRAEEQAA